MRRRRRRPIVLAVLLAFGLVAAACGGDDDDDGGAADTTAGGTTEATSGSATTGSDAEGEGEAPDDLDSNGVLRIATSLLPAGNANVQFDPTKLISPLTPLHYLIYDTLLREMPDGSFEPSLAESAEVVDPSTIHIVLREGLVFSDGAPLDAEAARAGIQRNVDATNPGAFATELDAVQSITVDSPREFTITLSRPIAGHFYQLLGRGETAIVSPKAVADGVDLMTSPVGAGPYVLESLQPENKISLVKNELHWNAENVRIPTIEYIHAAGPEATVNALRGGVADVADQLTIEIVQALEGAVETQSDVTDSTLLWGQLCKSREPFTDVRVRQAMNFALDRDELNTVIYGGRSAPQWGFWLSDSRFHNPEMTGYYERDLDRARELLTEAGYPDGFDMQIVVGTTGGISTTATELVQANWAEVGINVEIVQSSNVLQEFFLENKYPLQIFPLQRRGLDKVTRNLVPGSIGNICNWDHPGLNDVVRRLQAVDPNSDEAVELWHELEELAVTEAMNIFGVFGTSGNAWNTDRVGDVDFVANFQGQPFLDVRNAYVKQG